MYHFIRSLTIVADREFVGEKWFNWLTNNHIPFAIRIKKNSKVKNHHGKLVQIKVNRPGIVGDSTLQENTTMKTRNYAPEMKERAVRMLIEAKDDYPSTWSAIKAIAPKIGCTPETQRDYKESGRS